MAQVQVQLGNIGTHGDGGAHESDAPFSPVGAIPSDNVRQLEVDNKIVGATLLEREKRAST